MNLTCATWLRVLAFGFATIAIGPLSATAQQPEPGQPSPPAAMPLATYRPPALALVQPAAGGSVPQDRPAVVFRFAPGEPNDPIDVRSFAVTVDGRDQTRLFQVSAGEAWGPLSPADAAALDAGAHQLAARICSSRGACAELSATVSVMPSAVEGAEAMPTSARRRKLLGALLDAVRKILVP
jgi:hypothetical protein